MICLKHSGRGVEQHERILTTVGSPVYRIKAHWLYSLELVVGNTTTVGWTCYSTVPSTHSNLWMESNEMKVIEGEFEKRKKENTITTKDVLDEALNDIENCPIAVVILANPSEGYNMLYTNVTPPHANMILDVAKMNVLGDVVDDKGDDE